MVCYQHAEPYMSPDDGLVPCPIPSLDTMEDAALLCPLWDSVTQITGRNRHHYTLGAATTHHLSVASAERSSIGEGIQRSPPFLVAYDMSHANLDEDICCFLLYTDCFLKLPFFPKLNGNCNRGKYRLTPPGLHLSVGGVPRFCIVLVEALILPTLEI